MTVFKGLAVQISYASVGIEPPVQWNFKHNFARSLVVGAKSEPCLLQCFTKAATKEQWEVNNVNNFNIANSKLQALIGNLQPDGHDALTKLDAMWKAMNLALADVVKPIDAKKAASTQIANEQAAKDAATEDSEIEEIEPFFASDEKSADPESDIVTSSGEGEQSASGEKSEETSAPRRAEAMR